MGGAYSEAFKNHWGIFGEFALERGEGDVT